MRSFDQGLSNDPRGSIEQPENTISKKQHELVWLDISCLIINKMIGTGIFVSPAIVVLLAGSKWAALLMWIFGACYSIAR